MLLMLLAGCGGSEPSAPRIREPRRRRSGGWSGRSVEARRRGPLLPRARRPPRPPAPDSNGAGFQVEWITDPSLPPLNEQFTVRLRLLDPSGSRWTLCSRV